MSDRLLPHVMSHLGRPATVGAPLSRSYGDGTLFSKWRNAKAHTHLGLTQTQHGVGILFYSNMECTSNFYLF